MEICGFFVDIQRAMLRNVVAQVDTQVCIYTGPFCGYIGLFGGYIGLLGRDIGLFCCMYIDVGLFCGDMWLFCGHAACNAAKCGRASGYTGVYM